MHIDKATMTGADDSTKAEEMFAISKEFPFVEWGILFSTFRMGEDRYPTYEWIEKTVSFSSEMNFAAHICGDLVYDILQAKPEAKTWMDKYLTKFQRVQFNFKWQTTKWDPSFYLALPAGKQYLFQVGRSEDNDVMRHAMKNGVNAGALFDRSGGRGISPEAWPQPLDGVYCGYAGGLGPDNIDGELKKIDYATPDQQHLWLDMESKIRKSIQEVHISTPDAAETPKKSSWAKESEVDMDKVRVVLVAVRNYPK